MATTVTFAGTNYDVPQTGDSAWSEQVTNYLVAIASGTLQTTGGTFGLTSDVDFGSSFGLRSAYYKSRGTVASAGILRLANDQSIGWRNAANGADKLLKVNSSDQLEFDGNPLLTLALGTANYVLKMDSAGTAYEWGAIANANIDASAAIAYSKLALSDSIVNADVATGAAIAYSKLALSDSIVNADVSASAAIAMSKLAALTASRAVQTSASGVLEAAAVTSTELGYLSGVTSAVQTQLNAKANITTTGAFDNSELVFTDASGMLQTEGIGTADFGIKYGYLSGLSENVQDALTANTAAIALNTAKVSADGSIGTHSDVDVTTSTPANGNVLTYDGTNWVPGAGGSGSGEVNFNENPNAVAALDNTSADDVGDWIDSGTGTTSSRTTTTSEIPRSPYQETAIKILVESSGTDYTRLRFRVPPADRSKKLKIEWAQVVGSTYATGDLTVSLYNYSDNYSSDEAEVDLHGSASIPAQASVYYNEFDADDREYYELRISRAANGGDTTDWVALNDVIIGPGKLHSGAVVGRWESFTPVWSNETGHSASSNNGYKRRVGDSLELYVYRIFGGDGTDAANHELTIPDSLTIADVGATITLGNGSAVRENTPSSDSFHPISVIRGTSTALALWGNTPDADIFASLDGDAFGTSAGYYRLLTFRATVPIAEWAGSGVLNTIVQDNLTEWTSYTPGNVNNWGTDASGTTGVWKRVGDSMRIRASANLNTPSGLLTWSASSFLPSGYTIDESKLVSTVVTDRDVVGDWVALDGTTGFSGGVHYDRSEDLVYFVTSEGSINATGPVPASASWGSGASVCINIEVPITEWAGSQSSLVGFAGATSEQMGLVKQGSAVADTTDVSDTATQLNALLAALRTAGVIAS